MKKIKETLKAKSLNQLDLLFRLHYQDKFFYKENDPYKKFNWRKLRFEWYQDIWTPKASDCIEYVYNLSGLNSKEITWSFIAPNGVTYKKIFYAAPEDPFMKGYKEWAESILKQCYEKN